MIAKILRTTTLIAVPGFMLSACFLFGTTTPASKQVAVKFVNETAGTSFCKVSSGLPKQADYQEVELSVAPGASADSQLNAGAGDARMLCAWTCDGEEPAITGCGKMVPSDGMTLAVVEGKANKPPDYDASRHYYELKQGNFPAWKRDDGTIAMYNLRDPAFAEWEGGAVDPWGDLRERYYTIEVSNMLCKHDVSWRVEDSKGMPRSHSAGVESTSDAHGDEGPVYLAYDPPEGPATFIWDLPAGDYEFEVSADCKTLELVSEEHGTGTDTAKPMGPEHERNNR